MKTVIHWVDRHEQGDAANPPAKRDAQAADPKNLMNYGVPGNNVQAGQRTDFINLIQQQQKK